MRNLKKIVPLFWWSESRLMSKSKENYGDLLSKYLVEKISGRQVKWVQPKKMPWYAIRKLNFLTVGSILPHATKNSIVWGSGIIDEEHEIAPADFRAVRGPRTRDFLIKQNLTCPKVYGDPALLLPIYYNPKVSKIYKVGVIPHYNDYGYVKKMFEKEKDILIIDLMTVDIEEVTRQILSCKMTICSSLHGLIVSHAYQIPSIWVVFSDKIFGSGIKYPDYLESVDLPVYRPPYIEKRIEKEDLKRIIEELPNCPKPEKVSELQTRLMQVCPF